MIKFDKSFVALIISIIALIISLKNYKKTYPRNSSLNIQRSIQGTKYETQANKFVLVDNDGNLISEDISNILLPTGTILMWSKNIPPDGWLLCDGSTIPSQYNELRALIGDKTPDFKSKVPVGYSNADSNFNKAIFSNVGSNSYSKTLSVHELPSHSHSLSYAREGDSEESAWSSNNHWKFNVVNKSAYTNRAQGGDITVIDRAAKGIYWFAVPKNTNTTGSNKPFSMSAIQQSLIVHFIIKT